MTRRRPPRRPGRVRAALVLWVTVVVGIVATGALSAGPALAAPSQPTATVRASTGHSVVVVGVLGLRWDDLSPTRTPTLWRLAAHASTGSLSVRAGGARTCPLDGWLTLGAGNRASGPATDAACRTRLPLPAPRPVRAGGVVLPAFAGLRTTNARHSSDVQLGLLGRQVAGAGRCVAAVGPLAAYGAADERGRVPVYLDAISAVSPAFFARCPVTLVSLDALRDYGGDDGDPSLPSESAVTAAPPRAARPSPRAVAVAQLDRELAEVAEDRPAGSTLLVVGLSEVGHSTARLHVALASGPGPAGTSYDTGWLSSASTRRAPFVQLIDVAPTVLGLLGQPAPDAVIGQPLRPAAGRPHTERATADQLIDLDRAAVAQARLVPPFFTILVLSQLAIYLLAGVALRRGWVAARQRPATLVATRVAALAYAAAPVSTYLANLVPWWRADRQLLTLLGVVALVDAAIVAVALLGPWRRRLLGPLGAIAGATFLVLAGDVLTGAHLQLSSMAGYSPLVAGRFAGFGNVAYAVFATGALLFAAALAHRRSRRTALAITLGVGAVAVVLDGSPLWGSDLGGVLALVPGTAVLAMMCARIRVSAARLAIAGLAGVALVTAFAVADYLRPQAQRTHLGRFVGQVLDGSAGGVVRRKAAANLALLTHSWLTALLPVAVIVVAFVLLRPDRAHAGGLRLAFDRAPALRAGLVAVLVTCLVGFFVNDSGVAIPALAITLAVPLAIAAGVRAVELAGDDEDVARTEAPAASALRC